MDYGLYLSASGIIANSYRQDVISNNLANVETLGFKRNQAVFQQRLTEAQTRGLPASRTNRSLEDLGGGLLASNTVTDFQDGSMDAGTSPADAAIMGRGFFAVQKDGKTCLTRDGRFTLDGDGNVVLSGSNLKVMGADNKPIRLETMAPISIGNNGTINQNGKPVGQIGTFDVPNLAELKKVGGNLLQYADPDAITSTNATVRGGMLERSNVEPTTELTTLMETQRALEANANLIRYQDQMLSRLCNDVGKIG